MRSAIPKIVRIGKSIGGETAPAFRGGNRGPQINPGGFCAAGGGGGREPVGRGPGGRRQLDLSWIGAALHLYGRGRASFLVWKSQDRQEPLRSLRLAPGLELELRQSLDLFRRGLWAA